MINYILSKLYAIDHIPTHPLLKKRIEDFVKAINFKDNVSLSKLAQYIAFDPSIAVEFLKIANSGSFGYKKRISSINHALLALDDDLINLIISQHPLLPDFSTYRLTVLDKYLSIIKHSIEVYIIVQNLLDRISLDALNDENYRDELLAASVLHDIGLLFLLLYFPDEYNKTISGISSKDLSQKQPAFHIHDHAFIGSILCEYWKLPHSIRTSIAFHHYPWVIDEELRTGAEILYISDALSSSFYEIFYDEGDIFSIEEHIVMKKQFLEIIEKYDIDITDIAEIREESLIFTERIIEDLGFSSPGA